MSDETSEKQIPASRMTDQHVDDAIIASQAAQSRRDRQASRQVVYGRIRTAVQWVVRKLQWFIRNAKDIVSSMALVTSALAVAELAGWIDLAAFPDWVSKLAAAMREVF